MNYEILANLSATECVPDNWSVVVADVKGSTEAVRMGRYRDVNLAGAACIAAVRNAYSALQAPYVFGGDGASFLIAQSELAAVIERLLVVKDMMRQNLGLDLRVGHVPMTELRARGADVRFGFLKAGPTEILPFFRGRGVALAEDLIKQTYHAEKIPNGARASETNIQGLSCRLLPFPAKRGSILCVLIEPKVDLAQEDDVLQLIFSCLTREGPLERFRPVTFENYRRPWLSPTWKSEASLHIRGSNPWQRLAQRTHVVIASILSKILLDIAARFSQNEVLRGYTQAMLVQSDWIKMDGTLRLVIDINQHEERQLLSLLEQMQTRAEIIYGVSRCPAAVMTCHLQSMAGQRHTHFIDGDGGGLTKAAIELKSKKNTRAALSIEDRNRSA